jgi:hypothetical protein
MDGATTRPNKPARRPTVLTQKKVEVLFQQMFGLHCLIARLVYVTGMRLMDCMIVQINDDDLSSWLGIVALAAIPKTIVDKVLAEPGQIISRPEVRIKISNIGVGPTYRNTDDFQSFIQNYQCRREKMMKEAGMEAI